ncbi:MULTISPECIES: hypothetical protein [Acinetobacter]|uniref:hypothetical protein n=1 Tax=Acinetobacter TaxID=469 RepID=UPI00028E5F93|nr:hypothetical protein [Acinetobacter radioresistens]EKU3442160.1 hypothetical protein [Acinetobacter baumannii]EKU3445982.1 hypothetical protein [Acinetobacter baumannii]BBL22352.1 hypothetical protein ACRAD_30230 [Acinetobacter radioresistens DSM 6976 = NBRC 102413 = CIP 103788]
MAITANDVQRGWLFKTPNNQERVVLGFNEDNKVVYASRGGNVKNSFDHREACSIERFVDSCSERLEQYSDERLADIIVQCNAQNLTLN